MARQRKRRNGRAKYKTAYAKKKANKRRYSRKYLKLLNIIRVRDHYKCGICDKMTLKLEIHHIRKYSTHVALRQNPCNLICLCKDCHSNITGREKQFQSLLFRKARHNQRRYKKNPMTREEIMDHYNNNKLIPEEYEPFKFKSADEQKIQKSKEHYLSKTYRAMMHRCYRRNNSNYKRYGGRGIKVYEEWKNDRNSFIKWVNETLGPRPDGYSLDRIDNDKNYEPGNLRWASAKGQAANRSTSFFQQHEAEAIFILHHKYKKRITELQLIMNANNPTIIRQLVLGKTYTAFTYKYISIVENSEVFDRLEKYINENPNST